ncbi:MAG TPA: hypothetical protein VFS89_03260 [Nitrosospira sp.]|uniref:hypothetical protein n=1 Tax=Nitrosovibrio sp. Nv6 TaxID=1855340 RepID=UPI000B88A203|nr:hypothetical protein [Nitrosovibrio sp. Nv6]HEU4854288.1 hypothetical protein [Nitrosospira sp.]
MKAPAEATWAELARAVGSIAQDASDNTSARQKWKWMAMCIVVALVCISWIGWYATGPTPDTRQAMALDMAKPRTRKQQLHGPTRQKGRWLMAYRFAQSGELQRLARCQGKGWVVQNGNCYVHSVPNEGIYGWSLPQTR